MASPLCASIKSKKHPEQRCAAPASKGDFCARHAKAKNQIRWTGSPRPQRPLTRRQKYACEVIRRFTLLHVRRHLRRIHGPSLYNLSLSHNDRDIYSLEPLTSSVPFTYHFSYLDSQNHIWTFDLRFLLQLLQYGNDLKNPFSQEIFPASVIERLQKRATSLRQRSVPIVYTEPEGLTSEQVWNQKVLDVFLKLTALGFGANVLWFETLTVRGHEMFYKRLWTLWNEAIGLTEQEKERLVPGHRCGRTPLFKWQPEQIEFRGFELKWWRKQNLALMNAFLSRGQDKDTLGCGAIYVLTALAQTHPRAAEAFPWLSGRDD